MAFHTAAVAHHFIADHGGAGRGDDCQRGFDATRQVMSVAQSLTFSRGDPVREKRLA